MVPTENKHGCLLRKYNQWDAPHGHPLFSQGFPPTGLLPSRDPALPARLQCTLHIQLNCFSETRYGTFSRGFSANHPHWDTKHLVEQFQLHGHTSSPLLTVLYFRTYQIAASWMFLGAGSPLGERGEESSTASLHTALCNSGTALRVCAA